MKISSKSKSLIPKVQHATDVFIHDALKYPEMEYISIPMFKSTMIDVHDDPGILGAISYVAFLIYRNCKVKSDTIFSNGDDLLRTTLAKKFYDITLSAIKMVSSCCSAGATADDRCTDCKEFCSAVETE